MGSNFSFVVPLNFSVCFAHVFTTAEIFFLSSGGLWITKRLLLCLITSERMLNLIMNLDVSPETWRLSCKN